MADTPFTVLEGIHVTEPVLILGLEGWLDVGLSGAAAVATLVQSLDTRPVAVFDADRFVDHRARRPTMRVHDGVNTGLTWPAIELRAGTDGAGHDVLLLTGPEPDLRWHEFAATVVDIATQVRVRLTASMAAFPAAVPHTRPVRLTTTAGTPELAGRVGFLPASIDVPAGMHSVLEVELERAGIPAVGLWAQVPGYLAGMPYPAASAALIEGLATLSGLRLETVDLHAAAAVARERIDTLIAASEEHREMVRQLEAQHDAAVSPLAEAELPTGDELASELERFLRTIGDGRAQPPGGDAPA